MAVRDRPKMTPRTSKPTASREHRRRIIRRRRLGALAVVIVVAGGAVAAGLGLASSGGGHSTSAIHRSPGSKSLPIRLPQPEANIYSHTRAGMLTSVTRRAPYLVYAPDSDGNGVYVINPKAGRVIRYIQTGAVVQHVVPSWDLRTLYATNDEGNSLTPIDPFTGKRAGPNIAVTDPYNMYFTPDGRHAIVVEERMGTLAFRDPHTFRVQKLVPVNCSGVDHMDFSADGSFAVASCEFSGQMVRINLRTERPTGYLQVGGSPQDVKLSPDGRVFYVANRYLGGVQLIDARSFRLAGFIRTAPDAHGLYVSRDTRDLYVTNRSGSIFVVNFGTRRVVAIWHTGGSPDMGNVSPDGQVLWVSSRYNAGVFAISTRAGRVMATVPAGVSPHGVCVWPQPGRYSTGHTGVMR
jgi:DNA-binding beta-propeller fold protein YncE